MKKLLSIILCVVLSLSFATFHCLAASADNEILPLVNAPCSGGNGKCNMYSFGLVDVYDHYTGDLLMENACFWQCRACYTGLATQGDPLLGMPIGNYVFCAYYQLTNTIWNIMRIDPSHINYTSNTRIEGIVFKSDSK